MFSMRTKMKPKFRKLIFQDVDWAYTFELGFNWGWFVKKTFLYTSIWEKALSLGLII